MPRTLHRIFLDAAASCRKPAMFMRKSQRGWESIPPERAVADVESVTLGLAELGVRPGDRVALLSENRYEWAVSDIGILALGAVTVPIYPTLTGPQVQFILENSEARVCIVSTPAQLDKLHAIADRLPNLTHIVAMEPAPPLVGRDLSFSALLEKGGARRGADGAAFRAFAEAVKPDDLATIIYTSGTTGEPKGAMLQHSNISSNVESCLQVIELSERDSCLSFLPLCHIFERMAGQFCMLQGGATIAYAQSLETVAADAMEVRPTVLCGVPRFYEKVYARVMDNAALQPPLRRAIFHWGLNQGRERARAQFEGHRGGGPLASLADKLVGAKVRSRVGGRLRFCVSGGAPLNGKILEFFYAVGIPIIEGYGLTETSPVIALTRLGDARPGSVGPAVPGVEIRIAEEGEICTRGPHVMRGYFRNEAATQAVLRDGWFRTGDVGHLDDAGRLYITDRLKDLLVTSGGKKVAPQPLEGLLKTSKWISEAVLIGDQRPFIVALLVPNFVNLDAEAKAQHWHAASRPELLRRPEVHAMFQAEVDRLNANLAQYEKVKKFALLDRDLSQEAGELTPTLKVRRKIVGQKFADAIETLYAPTA